MEGKKYFIIVIGLIFAFNGFASNKEKIYDAYIRSDMQAWKTVIDQMQRENTTSAEFLIELVNYQYGYIGWCIGESKNSEAKKYLDMAEKNLEKLEQQKFSPSEINAYKSAFNGFKIGLSPIKAPVLGPKSVNHAKQAMELDKTNPMGFIQNGNCQFYMPAVFGGSKKTAVEHFEYAMKLMEKNTGHIQNNWNYLSLLTLIAQSYDEMNDNTKAELYFKKILEKEPRFVYVKNELFPEFQKKLQK
jgi:tetratricopeptide (TPR) repeat protein